MKEWIVVYGEYSSEQKHALNKITAYMQNKIDYVFATEKADVIDSERLSTSNSVIIGTPNNNKYIKKLIGDGVISLANKEESYTYAVLNDIFGKEQQPLLQLPLLCFRNLLQSFSSTMQ